MVDVRPLLFANALFFMLLLTAGFARVVDDGQSSGKEIPPVYTEVPSQISDQSPEHTPEVFVDTGEDDPFLDASPDNNEEDIFADTSSPEETDNSQDSSNLTSNTQPSEITGQETTTDNQADQLVEVEIVDRPVAETVEPSKPIADSYRPDNTPKAAYVEPPKAPEAKLGKLTVRSNVNGDTVLIDGKPYGSTKLEVELKPGRYDIEVAKAGHVSWKGKTNVIKGQANTIIARLEKYTSVDYQNGRWAGNVTTGEGTYRESDGTEYVGSFVKKAFHGKGNIRYPDGTSYSGDWFEGKMHGRGSLNMNNGDSYVGEFSENQFNGDGTLTKTNGDTYSGFWVNGQLTGEGTLTTKDGLLYVGGFSENLFHGEGSLTYPDGTHYEGSFSNGKYHGKGIEIFATGKKYEGQFMDGQYHGQGEIFNPNGSKISGTFKFGKPFGKATLTTPEGEVFTARTNEPGVCYRDKSYRATQCPPMEGW